MGSYRVRHDWCDLAYMREGCMNSLCPILIGWWWGNRVISQGLILSVFSSTGSRDICAHDHQVINAFYLEGVWAFAKQLRKYASDSGIREELKILWLSCDWSTVTDLLLKFLPVILDQLLFLLLHVHILSIINSWARFLTQGRSRLQLDYSFFTEAGRGDGGMDLSQDGPIRSCSVTSVGQVE